MLFFFFGCVVSGARVASEDSRRLGFGASVKGRAPPVSDVRSLCAGVVSYNVIIPCAKQQTY